MNDMNRLTLTLKEPLRYRLDMRPLTQSGVLAKGPEAVARLRLSLAGERVKLGDLFTVEGAALQGGGGDQLVIAGDGGKLDCLGAGWRAGTLRVAGSCGDYLGAAMTGGVIEVAGDAGGHAACGMAGGRIHIAGGAGDAAGGAFTGQRVGMTGGVVHILGRAGDRLGERMRRGLILVAGDAGAHCAARLIAGTICVLGAAGPGLGLAMRRGTLILPAEPFSLPATFNDCGSHDLPFFGLLMRHLSGFGGPFAAFARKAGSRFRKYAGDTGVGGQGEILIPARLS